MIIVITIHHTRADMKKGLKGLLTLILFTVLLMPSVKASAAVQPAVPTGLGFYGQNKNEFALSWAIDPNIILYGVDQNFGYEVVVTTAKGKKIGTYDKNTIYNNYDSDFKADDSKIYMVVKSAKMSKQAFKFKVRAYVFDETGAKLYSDYSSEKVIVPRANIKSLKATSKSTGKIKWQKIAGAKSYTVYVSSKGGTKFKKQGTTKSTSYTVKNMKLYKTYPVYVVANGVKVKKKKYNSTKPQLKTSNASTIKIFITY